MKMKLLMGLMASLVLVGCGSQSNNATTQEASTAPAYVMTANGKMLSVACLQALPANSLRSQPQLAKTCVATATAATGIGVNSERAAVATTASYYYPPYYWGSNYASPYTGYSNYASYGNYSGYNYGSYLCSSLLGQAWGATSDYSCYQSIFGYNNNYTSYYNQNCSSSCLYSWSASCYSSQYGSSYGTNYGSNYGYGTSACYSGYQPYSTSGYGYGYGYIW